MEKQRRDIDKLLWTLNFINQDIDGLKTGDFLKLFSELREYFLAQIITVSKLLLKVPFESNTEMEPFIKALESYAALVDNNETREIVKGFQKDIRDFIEQIFAENKKVGIVHLEFLTKTSISIVGNQINIIKTNKCEDPSIKSNRPAILEIAELIYNCSPDFISSKHGEDESGFFRSIKNLKRCQSPGCHNFFWQVHKKEKNFCSNKCAMRAYVKAKREAEKEKKP